jgi:hypothetical protein
MPRILTKLRISEVWAVDRGAGEGVKVMLIKRFSETAKESTMSTSEHLDDIMKHRGPIALAKYICESGAHGISESAFTAAVTRHAQAQHPNLTEAQAFAKVYENESVWRACAVLKAAEFAAFDVKPIVVYGDDARDVDNATAAVRAYEEIVRIGREKFPYLPPAIQFARIFEDKNYAALAARANRVRAGDVYSMANAGPPYAKSDPTPNADTAYDELMRKAEAYRDAHPELSISQCFDKIYTDPANIEIAKRERMESAPR